MIAYTDGSCLRNPGPGGYAWISFNENDDYYYESSGYEQNSTNNRMELKAIIDCIQYNTFDLLTIYSDSKYIVDSVNKNYNRKKNLDLWEQFDNVKKGKKIILKWVKGHSGNKFNDYVDNLARISAKKSC